MTGEVGFSIRGVVKVYPGTRAMKGVDFDLRMGALNMLVGENRAGKSTLMKVIAGVESLTGGRIEIGGREVQFRFKADSVKTGIGIVSQELNLFANLTVAENIFTRDEPVRAGVEIDPAAQGRATAAPMRRLEQDIAPDTPLDHLRVGQQQIVETAKALGRDARMLILDQPTSALSATEVEVLFRVIAELKPQGVGIVYISHRLDELIRVGDWITVRRDGEITGSRPMAGVDVPWIVTAMIGEKTEEFPRTKAAIFGAEVFRAKDITLPRVGGGYAVDHVSLSVRRCEIVGLYGLIGAGRTEFLQCVMAQHPASGGRMFVDGAPLTDRDVAGGIARGIALIREDCKRDGPVQIMAIHENLTPSPLGPFTRLLHLGRKAEAAEALEFVKRLTIKIASPEDPVSILSGGNQQKEVIGKALMTSHKILLMDEPSRGIDIGAKAEVFRTMRDLSADGLGILFVTSDLDEVLALSDRIPVLANGRTSGEFPAGTEAATLIAAATPSCRKDQAA